MTNSNSGDALQLGAQLANPFDPNGLYNAWNPNGVTSPVSPNNPINQAIGQGVASLNPFLGAAPLLDAMSRPDFWIRAGIVVAGIGLVVVGIIVLVSTNKTVGSVLTQAGKAATISPVGAAASAAAEAI